MSVTVRMIYASRASEIFIPTDIVTILESSNRNNLPMDLTGVLFFQNGFFLQALEGPRSAVNQLYQRLLDDPRHDDVEVLSSTDISDDRRLFGQWTMKNVAPHLVSEQLKAYSNGKQFNPYLLNAEQAQTLLHVFAQADDMRNRQTAAARPVPAKHTDSKPNRGWIQRLLRR